ncbi:hypothetical protein GCM10023193_44140 [Planotetraspora kaengkrachanensis]|uniref:SH3 domain-containing protein n=1 Tax=Planotetraspora kaengkrachanensis TaxID=575193 RepID=A0A8J3PYE1_9ACTN|nr:hypothetical protein Pka01_65430 [Planotetraspora kaengkrachanensis]
MSSGPVRRSVAFYWVTGGLATVIAAVIGAMVTNSGASEPPVPTVIISAMSTSDPTEIDTPTYTPTETDTPTDTPTETVTATYTETETPNHTETETTPSEPESLPPPEPTPPPTRPTVDSPVLPGGTIQAPPGFVGANIYEAPWRTTRIVAQLPNGTYVRIICTARGELVSDGRKQSTLWNRVEQGFVPDVLVYTGSDEPLMPSCN